MTKSYQELKYDRTVRESIESIKSKTRAYYLHLVDELQRALPGKGNGTFGSPAQECNMRLHKRFADEMKQYDEQLCIDLAMNIDDSTSQDYAQLHQDWDWSYAALKLAGFGKKLECALIKLMREAVDNVDTLDLLFSEKSTHLMKRALDFYVGFYTDHHDSNVSVIVEKLKVVSELQKILLTNPNTEKDSKAEDEKSQQSILLKLKDFKQALASDRALDKNRNKGWDTFVGVISFIIILPVSLYDYWHGKRNFIPPSTGKEVKGELTGMIDKVEQLKRSLSPNYQHC